MKFRTGTAILLSVLLSACGRGPDDTAVTFVKAANAGRTAEALEQLDPTVREMGGPKLAAAVGAQQKKNAAKGELKDVTVDSTKVDGDYATVVVREKFSKASDATSNMKMRKVDGKWFVTM